MGQLYKNPRELTPNQEKYKKFYCRKSGDSVREFEEIPEQHHVYEWSDGAFVDYVIFDRNAIGIEDIVIKRTMNIYCFFSLKDTVKKFREIYKVAKAFKCDTVQFTTWRNRDAFSRILDKMGSKYPKMRPIETTFEMIIGEDNED